MSVRFFTDTGVLMLLKGKFWKKETLGVGLVCSGLACSDSACSGVECSGVECSGVECSGVESALDVTWPLGVVGLESVISMNVFNLSAMRGLASRKLFTTFSKFNIASLLFSESRMLLFVSTIFTPTSCH